MRKRKVPSPLGMHPHPPEVREEGGAAGTPWDSKNVTAFETQHEWQGWKKPPLESKKNLQTPQKRRVFPGFSWGFSKKKNRRFKPRKTSETPWRDKVRETPFVGTQR